MTQHALDVLLQQRLDQLKSIADRRNDLLREMYLMMRRRNHAGQVFALADQHEEQDLHLFLQRFDISEHLESGSISNLTEDDVESSQGPSIPCDDGIETVSKTRSRSSSEEQKIIQKPEITPQTATPAKVAVLSNSTPSQPYLRHVPEGESEDELDLFGPYHRSEHSDGTADTTAATSHEVVRLVDDDLIDGDGEEVDNDEEEPDDQIFQLLPDSDMPISSSPTDDQHGSQRIPQTVELVSDDDRMVIDHDEVPEELEVVDKTSDAELSDASNSPSVRESVIPEEMEDEMEIESDMNPVVPEKVSDLSESLYRTPRSPTHYALPEVPIKTPRPIFIVVPDAPLKAHNYAFDPEADSASPGQDYPAPSPTLLRSGPHTKYSLPPLKSLPLEYNRKNKPKQRKRDREKDRNESRRESNKDDWTPMGLNRWIATINANPVWKRVTRATKCLSSRDWAVAVAELRLARTADRIEALKDGGCWSFRQPKKQRGVGGLVKSHWDYLMDEMRWMRIDFREERKWKMALAYNLSTSVLEWHAAKSWSERFAQGIAVRWKRPLPVEKRDFSESTMEEPTSINAHQHHGHPNTSLLGLDYGSEDEDEDEQDREVVDALQPSTLLEEALETAAVEPSAEGSSIVSNLKKEELEDQHALDLEPPALDSLDMPQNDITSPIDTSITNGLKTTSQDVILGFNPDSQSGGGEVPLSPIKPSSKANIYAPFRERITYSDDQELFLSLADLCLHGHPTTCSVDEKDRQPSPPTDLSTIFPDLQPLGLLDVAPTLAPSAAEGRKRSEKRNDKDDPNKRAEDTTYSKLFPASQFMRSKPTLLGPLLPSKKWKKDSWAPIEEAPIIPEHDGVTTKVSEDSALNELFENRASNTAAAFWQAAALKDTRKKSLEQVWTPSDDALLKSCIDKYPYNWYLIAECFNASRVTISTDKRSARDCLDRWREKWGSELRLRQQDPSSAVTEGTAQSPATQSPMTTRGVKRMASVNVASPTISMATSGPEPRKRRRHMLMQETIRKYTKKRIDALQKANAQRKPSGMHETHGQYAKMPKLSPAELIRLKAERDAREQQEILARKRHVEELGRQVIQARLSQQNTQLIQQQQQTQQQSPHQQGTAPQPAGASSITRPASIGIPATQVPQIRTQVNISQQQRLAAAALVTANARLSPQQQLQVHGQQGRTIGQAGQSQVLVQGFSQTGTTGQVAAGNGATAHGESTSPPGTMGTNGVGSPRRASSMVGGQYYLGGLTAEQMNRVMGQFGQ